MATKTIPPSAHSSDASSERDGARALPPAPKAPAPIPRWVRHVVRVALQLAADGTAIVLAYRGAYEIRFHWAWWLRHFPITGNDPGWNSFLHMLFTLVPLWLGIFWYAGRLYTNPWQRPTDRFLFIIKGALLGALVTLSASYIYDRIAFSRQMLLVAIPLTIFCVALSEALVLWIDGRIAYYESTSPLLLIGGGKVAELIRQNLRERHPGITVREIEQLDDVSGVLQTAKSIGASEIVLVRSSHSHAKILELAEACESAGLGFKMLPDLLELRLGEIQMDDSLGLPAYRVQHTSFSMANHVVKRVMDLALCAAIGVAAAIPFLFIVLLIRLDSKGPALYKQKRLGYKGRTFDAFKFRTMVVDAEAKLEGVKKAANDQKGGFFKIKNDPRVTRVGRLLRKYSLDEFPQFINVLLGEMSVVGPRPLAVTTGELEELLHEFGSTAKKRLNILPGITGLWQISGRSDVSAQQRFALDMFYIEHWSPGLDLQIILKTVPVMIAGKGAY